jgi:hypothetical protein
VDLYFWRIGRQELKQNILNGLSPLANKPLICLGSYTSDKPLDIPAGFLTTGEVEELQGGLDSDDEGVGTWVSSKCDRPVSLYKLAQVRYLAGDEDPKNPFFWPNLKLYPPTFSLTDLSRLAKENLKAFPEPERSQTLALANPELGQLFPSSKKWVLRNLTTREFVTADAIALHAECIEGPHIESWGFGEVVISRICWSSQPDSSLRHDLQLHRGVWAGHRLDIVTTEKFRKENGGEGTDKWKDISDEVAKEMETLCESKFGKDWASKMLGAVFGV